MLFNDSLKSQVMIFSLYSLTVLFHGIKRSRKSFVLELFPGEKLIRAEHFEFTAAAPAALVTSSLWLLQGGTVPFAILFQIAGVFLGPEEVWRSLIGQIPAAGLELRNIHLVDPANQL